MSNLNQQVYTTTHTGTVPVSSGTSCAGGTGQYFYSNGTNTTWTDTISINQNMSPNTLHVKGDAEFDGDVTFQGDIAIKGKSIKESLLAIEERLAILRPNEKLEEKWENLRGLRKAYMELEAEIIEKELIWATLKK